VRRLKNHSRKLQRADGELENDAAIKEPEDSRDQSIVNLQETGRYAEDPQSYRTRSGTPPNFRFPHAPILKSAVDLKMQKQNPKAARTRCTSARLKSASV
jgi:hypothetical protein